MAENREFFEQRREWSRRKHEVFENYLPQFTRILGRDRGTVYLVDAFAGRGYYGGGVDREPGSPIRAAEIARTLAEQGQYDLRCINVEADVEAFADLVSNTRTYSRLVDNRSGYFHDHIDRILLDTGSNPALFFLDPFGVGGLEWDTFTKIARRARRGKTEFLLNLNVPKFDRHAGWLDSFDQKHREAFIALLNRTTGSTEWQRIWDEPLPAHARYARIVEFYLQRIRQSLGFRPAAYPVRTVEDDQLKYYLVFATRHPLALRIMSSILYGVEQRFLGERAKMLASRPRQLDLGRDFVEQPSSIDELEHERISELQVDVLTVGCRFGRIRFDALQDELLDKWFGRMIEKHFREVCKNLIGGRHIDGRATGIKDSTVLVFR